MKKQAKCKKCKGSGSCSACNGTGLTQIINSRDKGATYERRVAKFFSTWCGFEIKRTPSSGGLMKTGDIFPVKPENMVTFPFNVELKNRQSWDFKDLLDRSESSGLFTFWKQCISDASKSNKAPLLIFTKKHCLDYCMMHELDALSFGIKNRLCDEYLLSSDKLIIFKFTDLLQIKFEDLNL